MTIQHPADRGGEERGRFARLAEAVSRLSSSPLFTAFCLALVAGTIAVPIAGLSLAWQLFAGDFMAAVTLLLLALLKNSETGRSIWSPPTSGAVPCRTGSPNFWQWLPWPFCPSTSVSAAHRSPSPSAPRIPRPASKAERNGRRLERPTPGSSPWAAASGRRRRRGRAIVMDTKPVTSADPAVPALLVRLREEASVYVAGPSARRAKLPVTTGRTPRSVSLPRWERTWTRSAPGPPEREHRRGGASRAQRGSGGGTPPGGRADG